MPTLMLSYDLLNVAKFKIIYYEELGQEDDHNIKM